MTTATLDRKDATEHTGQFDMSIRFGDRTTETDARWQRRSDVLAAWLLGEWKRRQREIAERN